MILLSLCLSVACSAQEEISVVPPDPVALLHEAVSIVKPKEREAATKRLLKLRSVKLDQWLEIMHDFGDFDDPAFGVNQTEMEAWVDGKRAQIQIDFYVPASYDRETASPLLVLLHGAGGHGGGMLRSWMRFADEHGYLLLAPTDPNSDQGYAFTQRERDEALQALRWMRLHYNVDENRVHLHGVSRGGHLAWDLGVRHSDRFASLVPAIGGPTWVVSQGRNNLRLVENLANTPIRQLQGSQDDPRLLRNLRLSFDRIRSAGNDDAMLIEFPELGHSFRTDTIDWPEFFASHPRNPWPESLTYRTARKENPRRSWLRIDRLEKSMDESFGIKVDPKEWQRMNEEQRAAYIQNMAEERTAKSHVVRLADGSFVMNTSGVNRCTLFFKQSWLGEDGAVEVVVNGKTIRVKTKTSKRVLLQDFVERFDRTFLPIAEAQIKKF